MRLSRVLQMLLPRRPQLFTAMLDSDTDDSDRND